MKQYYSLLKQVLTHGISSNFFGRVEYFSSILLKFCVLTAFLIAYTGIAYAQPISAVITGSQSICIGDDATVQVNIVGGTSPFTVTLSDGTIASGYISGGNLAISPGPVVNTNYTIASISDVNGTLTAPDLNLTGTAEVTVNALPSAPTGSPAQTFCTADNPTIDDVSVSASGTVTWFDAASDGNVVTAGTALVSGTTYYAENSNGTCVSATRLAVTTTISASPAVPTGSPAQTFCTADNPTIDDVSVSASGTVTWFDAASDGNIVTAGTALVSGTTYYAENSNGTCVSATRLAVTTTISASPAVPTGSAAQTFCTADNPTIDDVSVSASGTVTWFDAASDGNVVTAGTALVSGTTYYAENSNGTCVSATRLAVTVTVNPLPAISISTAAACSADLSTYSVSVLVSSGTVTSSAGGTITNSGNTWTITGIAAGANTTLTVTDANTCVNTLAITAPDCSCPVVAAPTSGGDDEYCAGSTIPTLTATAGAGETIDWYAAASGGTALATATTSYTPSAAGSYFAEARNITTSCVSATRTEIVLTENPLPTISISTAAACAPDLSTYSVSVLVSSGTVTSSAGGTITNSGNTWTITGIAAGANTTLTVTDANTCVNTLAITAPDCSCPVVAAPTSGGDDEYCAGSTIPTLTATAGAGETIDWYAAASGGTALATATTSYTPSAAGSYFAEARNITTSCVSATRTEIVLTENPLPTISISTAAACAPDLSTYSVSVLVSSGTVTSSAGGTITNSGNTWTITGIAAGANTTLTVTDANTCVNTLAITAPDCSCPVVAAPTSGGDDEYCAGSTIPTLTATAGAGETIDWYAAASGGTALATATTSYTPSAAGSYFAEARNITTSCVSATRTEIVLTENPLPTISISTAAACAPDLSTYSVSVLVSSGTVTSSAGGTITNSGNTWTITGIAAGANTTLTVTDANTCVNTLAITAPDCSCPVVAAPTSGGDDEYCAGSTIPTLTATAGAGETIDWYAAASGGTALATATTSYTPSAAGSYFAEARNITTSCVSATRTEIVLTENPLPTISISTAAACAPDLSTYSVSVLVSSGTVTSSAGGTITNSGNTWTITGIAAGANTTLTVTDANTCVNTLAITAPDCSCPVVAAPTSGGDDEYCAGSTIPTLTATAGAGETIDWYAAASGGTALATATTSYTPSAAGSYFAEARNITTSCVSATRTEIVLTENPLPTISISTAAACAPDLSTYSVSVLVSSGTVTSSAGGTITNSGNTWTITGIAAGANTTLTVTDANTCVNTLAITAPDCSCPVVAAPTSGGDDEYCAGSTIPTLTATAGAGETIDWYAAASGGTALATATTSYTPSAAGSYFAEARNITTSCVSATRTEIVLTENPLPTISISTAAACAPDLSTYSVSVLVSSGTVTSSAGGTITNSGNTWTITGIAAGANTTLTVTDANTCVNTLAITAPDCSCPVVAAPTSGGDDEYCAGSTIPTLTATAGAGETIDWYAAASGGTALATATTSYTPSAAGSYFAEARNITTSCVSATRTEIVLTENPLPTISISTAAACAPDLSTYSVSVLVSSGTVASSAGGTITNSGNTWTITGIAAGANTTLTVTDANTCVNTLAITAPDCSCPVVAAPTSGGDDEYCAGSTIPTLTATAGAGETIDWYAAASGGTALATATTSYTPSAAGSYFAEARNITTSCVSATRTEIVLTENPLPTISISTAAACAPDLSTYSVSVLVSSGTVTSSAGGTITNSGNTWTITGIAAGANTTLTVTDANTCVNTLAITAPDCSCPVVAAPTSGGDDEYCAGSTIPTLTATAGAGETIDWYAAASGGTALATATTSYTPSAAGSYFAEARNITTSCVSATRTEIVLTENPLPTISISTAAACAPDLSTYSVSVLVSSGTVTSSAGGTITNSGNTWTITGIAAGANTTLTVTDANTCVNTLAITAPDCSCPVVAAPTSGGDDEYCAGSTIPTLTATAGAGETIDWYAAASGGTALATATTSYTPSAAGSYFAEARNITTSCVSATRTEIVLTENPLPTISISTAAACAPDLSTYSVSVLVSSGTVASSAGGTITNSGNTWTITGIAAGANTTLTVTDANTCVNTLAITAPDCSCPVVAAPTSGGDDEYCAGSTIPTLTATAGAGETIDWYAAASGGTALATATTSYTPSAAGSYFAEARNITTSCVSATRTEIVLTENPLPTISISTAAACAPDLSTYSVSVLVSSGTVTSSAGGTITNSGNTWTITGIAAGANTTLTVTDANTCVNTLAITAPDCSCPVVAAPTSGGDDEYCAGSTIPTLTATAGAGETIDWYAAASGGTALATATTSYTPSAAGSYFAEARNITTSCVSATRTEIVLTENPLPTISISTAAACAPDLSTYSVSVLVSSGTVTSSAGGTITNSGNTWTITGIAAGANTTLTVTDANTCVNTLAITAPDCSCPVVAAPTSGGDDEYCAGSTIPTLTATAGAGETIDWYAAASGGTALATATTSYTPSAAGSYFAEARNITTSCVSATRTEIVLTENPLPTISISTAAACAPDLSTYSVSVLVSSGTVASSAGGTITNSGNTWTITGIAAGANTTLTVTDANTCVNTLAITAPDCSCPVVAAPTSGGDDEYCAGSTIPTLTATAGAGETIDWYAAASGGTALATATTSYTPSAAGSYFAEARNITTSCVSATRTEIVLTENPLPTISISTAAACAPDLSTYSVSVLVSSGTVTSSAGGTITNSGNTWTITGIAAGANTTLTVTDANTCVNTLAITAPDCSCPVVAAPTSGGDDEYCAGSTIPTLTATAGAGETIDWYAAASGGTALATATTSYTPSAAGSYFAEARNITTSCVSATRTEIVLTENPLPTISISTAAACAPDLSTYSVSVLVSSGTVTSSAGGTITNSGNTWTITGIAAGANTTLTVTDANTCVNTLAITAPDCSCPVVAAPTSGGDDEYCAGSTIPTLTATAGAGETIDWYAAASGGTALATATTSYTPSAAGSYFAEARNITTSCVSATRTEIVLTENPLPTISISTAAACAPDLSTYSVSVLVSSGTVTSSAGGTITNSGNTWTITGIAAGANTTLTVTDANTCVNTLAITAPDCSCPVVAAPTSGGDDEYCAGSTIPTLTATAGAGETIDWYAAASGGTALATATTSYTPSAAGSYFAEARNITTSCVSATRTEIVLTENPLPTISISTAAACAPDLSTYSVSVLVSSGTVTSSAGGTITNSGNTWTITGIAAGANTTLTVTDANTCVNTLAITAPDCSCPLVAAPTSGGNQAECNSGQTLTATATAGLGEVVEWYATASGGGTVTPTLSGVGSVTYYAQTRNTTTNCISTTRTPVSLEIYNLPSAPVSGGDVSYCIGNSIPTISATINSGETVDWYNSGGTLLLSNSSSYSPIAAGIYYAEARNTTTNCVSTARTAITVTVDALDDASFNYSAASYCVSAADPTPTITGLTGGSFSASSGGLSINSGSGAIDVSASTPGTYTVTYTTAGTCTNSSNVSVTIIGLDDASFNYSALSYCVSASDPTPTITGLAGGSFSASSGGLSINSGSGAIDVSASTPGTYTVTYTTAGACTNSSNVTVSITNLDDASFNYSTASFCVDAADPSANGIASPGGTFSINNSGVINGTSGAIDLDASGPGTYIVTYTTNGSCTNSSSSNVTILDLDDASFSYTASSFCTNNADPTPTVTGLAGGSFTSSPGGLSINSGSGAIDVSASTPGTYTVTYTTNGVCTNSSGVSITIYAAPTANNQNPSAESDAPGGNTATVNLTTLNNSVSGGSGTVSWYSNPGLTSTIGNPGSYVVTEGTPIYAKVDNGNCTNSAQVVYVINSKPNSAGFVNQNFNEDQLIPDFDLTTVFSDTEDLSNLLFSIENISVSGILNANINVSNDELLSITLIPNKFGSTILTIRATDTDGAFVEDDLSISIAPINDLPNSADNNVSTDEDISYTFNSTEFDFTDIETGSMAGIRIESLPAKGDLRLSGNPITAGTSISVGNIDKLAFTPDPNESGNPYTSFLFTVSDGTDNSSPANRMTIAVDPVNDIPTSANGSIETDEDVAYTFATSDFIFSDIDGGTFSSVRIEVLAGRGAINLNSNPITANTDVSIANINSGLLTYSPSPNENGTAYSSFRFEVNDGQDNSVGNYIMTINVNKVNDKPTFDILASHTSSENAGIQTISNFAFNIDDGDPEPAENQSVFFLVSNSPVISGILEFDLYPTITDNGTLSYQAKANTNGSATINVFMSDDGVPGGLSTTKSFTILVNPVNGIPSFTLNGTPPFVNEDSGPVVETAFGLNIDDGDDELDQTLTFNLTKTGGLLQFSSAPSIDPANGNLSYTPLPNSNGTATYSVTLSDGIATTAAQNFTISVNALNDAPTSANAAKSINEDVTYTFKRTDFIFSDIDDDTFDGIRIIGEETDGELKYDGNDVSIGFDCPDVTLLTFSPINNENNNNQSPYATFRFKVKDSSGDLSIDGAGDYTYTVNVNPVDDPPTGTDGSVATAEGITYVFGEDDFPFADVDNDTFAGIRIQTLESRGRLLYESVDVTAGLVATDVTKLTFEPVGNENGSPYTSFTFQVRDSEGDYSISSFTMSISVGPVNDRPTGADETITMLEDDTYIYSISDFTFNDVDNDNFDGIQIITEETSGDLEYDGVDVAPLDICNDITKLTFKPMSNENGSPYSSFKFKIRDNSGAFDISLAEYTMTINVTPVNDRPSFTINGNPPAINEDAGNQIVTSFVSSINDGDPELDQSLTFVENTTTSGNLTFAIDPSIDETTGDLTYTVNDNTFGSATVTVELQDDGTGTNQSLESQFTILVIDINDAPTINAIANPDPIQEDADEQTVSFSGVGAGENESQVLEVTAISSNAALVPNPTVVYTSPNTSGQLTYTPSQNMNGTAEITVKVSDGAQSNNSVSTSFFVEVTSVNDRPTINPISDPPSISENADKQTILISGISTGAGADEAFPNQTLTISASSSNPSLIPDPTVNYDNNSTGEISYTPAIDQNGTAVITVTVDDGQPQNNIEEITFTVSVSSVNNQPTLDDIVDPLPYLEDSGPQVVAMTGISAGGGENQTLAITAVSDNQLLIPDSNINIEYSQGSDQGNVIFTSLPNQFGTSNIRITINDGGNIDFLVEKSFLVTIDPVSDTPTVTNANANGDDQTIEGLVILTNPNDGPETNHFKITNISNGLLFKNDGSTIITDGEFISVGQGANGLKFTPTPGSSENGSFNIQAATGNDDLSLGGGIITATIFRNSIPISNGFNAINIDEDEPISVIDLFDVFDDQNHQDAELLFSIIINTNRELFDTLYLDNNLLNIELAENTSGNAAITIQAMDPEGAATSDKLEITVLSINDAPVLETQIIVDATQDIAYQYEILFTDPEGDEITIESAQIPEWLSFVPTTVGTALLSGTPLDADAGVSYQIDFYAFDTQQDTTRVQFIIDVQNINDNPIITSQPLTDIEEGDVYEYIITVEDLDLDKGDTLIFNVDLGEASSLLSVRPLDSVSIQIYGFIPSASLGQYDITITVTDSEGASDQQSYTLNVKKDNNLPVITTIRILINEDEPYVFSKADFISNFSDADGDTLTHIIISIPPTKGTLLLYGNMVGAGNIIAYNDIDSLVFIPEQNNSSSHEFEWNANDGIDYALIPRRVVFEVEPDPDPPVIDDFETDPILFEFANTDGAPLTAKEISDPEGDNIVEATISFSQGYIMFEDSLYWDEFTAGGLLEYDWDDLLGILTITGLGSTEDYTEAILALRYINTNALSPSTDIRTIEIELLDATGQRSIPYARQIEFENTFVDLDIPNGITPNDDGANDTWNIGNMDRYEENRVSVYSRSGELLFDSVGYTEEWDGTYNGELLPAGPYYYVIWLDKFQKKYSGTITILR